MNRSIDCFVENLICCDSNMVCCSKQMSEMKDDKTRTTKYAYIRKMYTMLLWKHNFHDRKFISDTQFADIHVKHCGITIFKYKIGLWNDEETMRLQWNGSDSMKIVRCWIYFGCVYYSYRVDVIAAVIVSFSANKCVRGGCRFHISWKLFFSFGSLNGMKEVEKILKGIVHS